MNDYPQFPPPPHQPQHPGQQYPQNPYGGQPYNPYAPPPAPEPPSPKKKHLWFKIGLAIIGVLVILLVIGSFVFDPERGNTEDKGAGAGPSLGAAPSKAEIDTGQVDKGEILRDSSNFQYLSKPEWIMPGAKYFVADSDGQLEMCSFGWMVNQPNSPNQVYNLTAGHCGDPGNQVYLDPSGAEDPSGFVKIGQFVAQDFAGEQNIQTGADYALIQIEPAMNKYIRYTPDITVMGADKLDLVGPAASAELTRSKPYTCHLGWRSGLSCGPFREITNDTNFVFEGISDHGDSGGVVWSFDESDPAKTRIYASGIVSWVQFEGDAAATNAKTINQVLTENGLQLLKD